MTNVTQISQYLYRKDPQKTLVRLSFYHFLKNASDSSKIVDFQFLRRFVNHCMNHPYWMEKQTHFEVEFRQLLDELLELPGIEVSEAQELSLKHIQVVTLRHSQEYQQILEKHLNAMAPLEQHRLVLLDDKSTIALSLMSSGGGES